MTLHPAKRLLLPLICCAPLTAGAAPLPLDQVLREAGDGVDQRAANAELEARYAAREQRDAESGWEMFGNANVGRYRELVTDDLRDDYYGRSFALGLRYSLLGSLQRKVDAVREADRDAQLGEVEQGLARARQRLALRSAYADWWRADNERRLCAGALDAARRAEDQVQERLAGKWILPSDARLMHSEWTAVTRRCQLQDALLDDTRASLESLGVQLRAGDSPVAEPLAAHPRRLAEWRDLLDAHPRVASRRAELASAEAQRERPWYSAIDSYFTLAQTREERSGSPDSGSGLSAGITVSAPLDLLDYGSSRQREGESRYQAASLGLEAERGRLLRELGKVLERQRRSVDEYVWRSERREAIDGIIGERSRRGDLDGNDAALRLLQAEVDRYNAGFAQIAAWHGAWLEESALRLFGDDSADFAALLGDRSLRWQDTEVAPAPGQDAAWNQGAYIWRSAPLLDPGQREAQLKALQAAGIAELHLGLDGGQLARLERTRGELRALIDAAHQRGMRVNLLLGDPAWIRPDGREDLAQLIGSLRDLPFDGLHLDLEVEQLGWPVPDRRLDDWLASLERARQASPWPLMISSHPRWFAEEAGRQPCVPCALERLGVHRVSLMIYTRNPQRSAERALAIAQRWPQLRFRLAQSLEPDQPADLSWADASGEQLRTQAGAWRDSLQAQRVGGIDWQSWSYYPRAR
ncbi:hypothetical protein ACPA5B_19115 [Pseudomonas solani]|uniref:hypothetical protein n=1 Tax=Pseudomonas solani TaxID=2731552 RepID=UPI003C2F0386